MKAIKYFKTILGSLIFIGWIVLAEFTYLSWLPSIDFSMGYFPNPLKNVLISQVLIVCGVVQLPITIIGKIRPITGGVLLLVNRIMLVVLSMALNAVAKPLNWIYAHAKLLYSYGFSGFLDRASEYNLAVAHSLDQHANCHGMYLFSDLFLNTGKGKQYGNKDETISHVTAIGGIEQRTTWAGDFCYNMLDFFDPGHNEKARNNEQFDTNIKEK